MTDWVDILLKEKFSDESSPSENIRWERFEALRRRKRLKRITWYSGTLAAAVVTLLIFLHYLQPPHVSERLASASFETHPHLNYGVTVPSLEEQDTPKRRTSAEAYSNPSILLNAAPVCDQDTLRSESKAILEEKPLEVSLNEDQNEEEFTIMADDADGRKMINVLPYIDIKSGGGLRPQSYFFGDYTPIDYSHYALNSHSLPISFSLGASLHFSPQIAITAGVELSYYRSKYNSGNGRLFQNVYYLGLPLRLDWVAWQNGPVSAWVGAGGKVDRLVYGKFGPARIHDKRFNWSLTGDAGIQYELFPKVGLFFSPEISYYFKPSNPVIQTYRTGNPLMITLGAGLRVSLQAGDR